MKPQQIYSGSNVGPGKNQAPRKNSELFSGADGKAGMVAIADVNAETDLEDFYGELKEKLAPFARPLFIRILKEMDMTGRDRSIDAGGTRAELCFPRGLANFRS